MSETPSLSMRLPVELLHCVFNLASASSRHACLNICLVASWARQIALPHLFHTVVIKDTYANTEFTKYIVEPFLMPNFRAACFVNNVWAQNSRDLVLEVIEKCDNITHLALNTGHFRWLMRSTSPGTIAASVSPGISGHALARQRDLHLTLLDAESLNLALTEHHNDDVTKKSPIFDKITHLRLTLVDSYKMRANLDHFSRLTHLCMPYYDSRRHQTMYLQPFLELQSLQMFVIIVILRCARSSHVSLENWVRNVRETDTRVYLVNGWSADIQVEWEREMRGGESVWERAIRYTNKWEAHCRRGVV